MSNVKTKIINKIYNAIFENKLKLPVNPMTNDAKQMTNDLPHYSSTISLLGLLTSGTSCLK
jgi:hypothetical protein